MATNFENSNFPCATGKEMTEVQETVCDLAVGGEGKTKVSESGGRGGGGVGVVAKGGREQQKMDPFGPEAEIVFIC